MEDIEITYTVLGFEEAGETTFDMEVSGRQYERLEDAELDGELLDTDYISENMPGLHKKILKAIRDNMEEEGLEPGDGMVEKRLPWGATYKEHVDGADHSMMEVFADDDDIEYEITI